MTHIDDGKTDRKDRNADDLFLKITFSCIERTGVHFIISIMATLFFLIKLNILRSYRFPL